MLVVGCAAIRVQMALPRGQVRPCSWRPCLGSHHVCVFWVCAQVTCQGWDFLILKMEFLIVNSVMGDVSETVQACCFGEGWSYLSPASGI